MNRLKLWAYVLLVVVAGAAELRLLNRHLSGRAVEEADGRLRTAAALLEARSRLLTRQLAGVAEAAARDPALAETLSPRPAQDRSPRKGRVKPRPPPPPPASPAEVQEAAEAAVRQAARAAGVELPRGTALGVVRGQGLVLRSADRALGSERERAAHAWLAAARGGSPRQGHARLDDAVYDAVSAPAPAGAALALAAPLDAAWAASLASAGGADVTVVADQKPLVSTLAPPASRSVAAGAPKQPGKVAGVGALGPLPPPAGLPLPAMPLLFAAPPAHRAVALSLEGLPGAAVVLSEPMQPRLAFLAAWQLLSLAALAGLLVAGLLLGATMTPARRSASLPRELLAAAERVGRGDFEARAPPMVGALGTVAEAINRAAEAAGASAAAPPPPAPLPASEPLPAAPRPETEVTGETTAKDLGGPPRAPVRHAVPARMPSPSDTSRLDGSELFGAAPAPSRPGAPAAPPPEAAPQAAPASEEQHWQQVFQEFLRVRKQCGEPSEGLTFDRFRDRLRKNREGLIQKYACRTVRFQAYVKDGKAALKATPVR